MLATISALLAIVLVAGAQTPGTEAANHAALQKVSVVRGETGISIELTAKGAITPRVETLSSPDRLVVDLPNTALATSVNRISVGNGGVTGVRIGTDASATTRVVVDHQRPLKYELTPGPGGKLTLKLDSGSVAANHSVAPAKASVPVVTAA
jgi:N-acetylmuramoyl-L-alanine amidase